MHPLGSLFGRSTLTWEETDIKHFLQQYLQRRLKTDALYCEQVKAGVATVRVASPAVHQEITLLTPDIITAVAAATTYSLTTLRIYLDR